jgi:glutamate N-acetyltransferase/amino-acid N-acetyltransferase
MSEHEIDSRGVRGFRFAGVSAGLKKKGGLDLGLVVADDDVPAAAVLTRNLVRAAPVELTERRIERGRARAVLVNSGNANACTGKPGLAAAKATTEAVAEAIGASKKEVLPASTGVIGHLLPAERVIAAVPALVSDLAEDGVARFARAIMTTDRWPKVARVALDLGGETVTVLGIAKGAGMIHPDMATTLAFVVTDAAVTSAFLRKALRRATSSTFNAVSVDGETSTNDTIVAMASGRAKKPIRAGEKDGKRFVSALTDVLGALARTIVKDGEGAEHVVTLEVRGAPSDAAAERVAERVARSLLVKTAIHGCDPNWGRILSAAGVAGVSFDPTEVAIEIGDVVVAKDGMGVDGVERRAADVMKRAEYTIRVTLGRGRGESHITFCDIGHEYVRINADYRT